MDNDLYLVKHYPFVSNVFRTKLKLVSDKNFVVTNSINMMDLNNVLIYEGDILAHSNGEIVGQVYYCSERAAYVLLDYITNHYFPLGSGITKALKIVGNVFENPDLVNQKLIESKEGDDKNGNKQPL